MCCCVFGVHWTACTCSQGVIVGCMAKTITILNWTPAIHYTPVCRKGGSCKMFCMPDVIMASTGCPGPKAFLNAQIVPQCMHHHGTLSSDICSTAVLKLLPAAGMVHSKSCADQSRWCLRNPWTHGSICSRLCTHMTSMSWLASRWYFGSTSSRRRSLSTSLCACSATCCRHAKSDGHSHVHCQAGALPHLPQIIGHVSMCTPV